MNRPPPHVEHKDPDGDGVREGVRVEVAEFARGYGVPGITDG